ncbi:MAG: efflux RND transporter periplasmic adaptor subunit [Verrucomicrobia bacterium]|nr:efflux RND transporter periplasmic adaptor subunit [Verrucomicrobiota bacterium]
MKNNLFIFSVLSVALLLGACSKTGPTASVKNDIDYYTCTMHPWVHSKKPGKCPVCAMDLVPVFKTKSHSDRAGQASDAGATPGTSLKPSAQPESHDFEVPIERQQQFGVTYAQAKRRPLVRVVRTVGLVAADKGRQWTYVARTEGYVQKLYVTSPGQVVEKDQDLLQVYSPDLATSEQELIKLLENRDHAGSRDLDQLIKSAKRRLRQWNLTDQQIEALEKNRISSEYLTLLSPFRGVVEDVPADQGARFSMGQKLISLADLSLVWVWAEFYQNEIPLINVGQAVSITFGSERSFTGVIAAVNPFVSQTQRTTKVRIDLPNPDLQLRPGMYVNTDLSVDLGEGLTVPINAVVPTGSRNIVFLDKGNGKLQPCIVQLGSQVGDAYQVLSGLNEGDRVVASANFLIDAESQVQGALQGFEQETATPSPQEVTHSDGLGENSKEPFDSLLKDYSAIQQQLAQDKTDRLKDSINDFDSDIHVIAGADFQLGNRQPQFMEELKALDEATERTFQANDLDGARIQFGNMSAALITLLTDSRPPLTQEWKVMTCPMWKKSPARWLQADQEIHNPFIGTAMPNCGQTIGSIGTMNLKAVR